ncbi:gametocyte-specific factor 1 homolog [Anabrus simplex]|uniref:gametocyte-specific factor 1 homolog n=1 Tax=Anabrus simplex TaxID=316456 RepID=UPI0034DCC86F
MDDELLICPYNKSHHIHRSRMSIHLTKCSKVHKGTKRVCPLDATHHLDESEFAPHLQTCPNRRLVEYVRYCLPSDLPNTNKGHVVEPNPNQGKKLPDKLKNGHWTGLPPQLKDPCCEKPDCLPPKEVPPMEENWDHLVGKVKYDPERQSELKPVLRAPQGKTKTERKKFRQEERMRYNLLANGFRTTA